MKTGKRNLQKGNNFRNPFKSEAQLFCCPLHSRPCKKAKWCQLEGVEAPKRGLQLLVNCWICRIFFSAAEASGLTCGKNIHGSAPHAHTPDPLVNHHYWKQTPSQRSVFSKLSRLHVCNHLITGRAPAPLGGGGEDVDKCVLFFSCTLQLGLMLSVC